MAMVVTFRGRRDCGGPLRVSLTAQKVEVNLVDGSIAIDGMSIKERRDKGWRPSAALRRRIGVHGDIKTVRISQRNKQ